MGVDHVVSYPYLWFPHWTIAQLLNQMGGSEAISDYSLYLREDFLLGSCWRTDTDKGSVFFLFAQLGVSIQSWYDQQRWIYCVLFRKPFHGGLLKLFFPREIKRDLMLFWTTEINKVFLYYLFLWLLMTYACIGDLVFIASSFLHAFSNSKMILWVFKILSLWKWMHFRVHLSRNVTISY